MSYETSIRRLEEIVSALSSAELPLEQALTLFEEGIACLRDATDELSRAEAGVKLLRQRADGLFDTTDFRG